ncbi:anthranilate synthase component II [Alkalibacter saccharofermentans]|uniref:Aminodeoxychorismate synthase, glutamine amidotransferase subunit n=1 Tax=Alkalibacter saccharofermentans DSM 14828 TaxID=1120975 RepID=A0A1M4TPI9_9FIRM|nr:aminodeoxychorismate/anthranilate synthase component II [Alkalibacter saccharofermentans]SHE46410.1 aminodeoxychorismate synthase, glutamine amidotransferase subunit [Alkalibacter saccharofermentans DSM 14828]
MILMIDNYDSFTYNLVQYIECIGPKVNVARNDKITVEEIRELKPDVIVISPGPGRPEDAGISLELVKEFKGEIPILGICLGHQTIAQAFGGKIVTARQPVHGKVNEVAHNGKGIFNGIKNPLKVTRYHSLVVERDTLPDLFEITCETDEGEIMGIRHKSLPVEGIQFHPEAILTEMGMELLRNFWEMQGGKA